MREHSPGEGPSSAPWRRRTQLAPYGRGRWHLGAVPEALRLGLCGLLVGSVVVLPLVVASSASAAAAPRAGAIARHEAGWQHALAVRASTGAGCFRAAFPSLEWHRTGCHAAPDLRRAAPARPSPTERTGPAPASPASRRTVGTANDYAAIAVGGTIRSATGTFTGLNPGITEKSSPQNQGAAQPTVFSLQLNTEATLKTPLCNGSSTPSTCTGWEQYVFTSVTNTVSIQYWLLTYGKGACPATWTSTSTTGSCVTNSPAVTFTGPKIGVADLGSTDFTASATAGGTDVLTLTYGGHAARMATPDSRLGLASQWGEVEFNVFGNSTRAEATFGPGTTIEPEVTLTDGALAAPTCVITGTTGETNNLTLTASTPLAARAKPTVAFEETNQSPSPSSCATAAGSATLPPAAGTPASGAGTPSTAPPVTGTPVPTVPLASSLVFKTQPRTVTVGHSFSLGVAITSAAGSVVTSSKATVVLRLKARTGAHRTKLLCHNPGDAARARAGMARFSCRLNRAGRGYVLVATSAGLVPGSSKPITSRRP